MRLGLKDCGEVGIDNAAKRWREMMTDQVGGGLCREQGRTGFGL